jgi:hypothetical protein
MRHLFIALPAVAMLGGSIAYADQAAIPGNAANNRSREGRTAAHEYRTTPLSRDDNGKVEQANPGPGMPPSSEAKGP